MSFGRLFTSLGIDNVITVFECLLLENRLVFVSKSLGTLSECVNASIAILNPLSWQYVFIPVLPDSLLSYCCAPMPFIVGILHASLAEVNSMPTEELLIIDCDKGKLIKKPPNSSFLSEEMRNYLKDCLSRIQASCDMTDKYFDLHVARCFVNLMYRLFGNYYKFFSSKHVFDQETFLESQPPQYQSVCISFILSLLFLFLLSLLYHWFTEFYRYSLFPSILLSPVIKAYIYFLPISPSCF